MEKFTYNLDRFLVQVANWILQTRLAYGKSYNNIYTETASICSYLQDHKCHNHKLDCAPNELNNSKDLLVNAYWEKILKGEISVSKVLQSCLAFLHFCSNPIDFSFILCLQNVLLI